MPTLSIAYVDSWADNVATTHIASAILEHRLGYEVKLHALAAGIALHGVATGKIDAFLGHCLPVQDEYNARNKGNIRLVQVNFKNGKCGLAVPAFCNITTISDLKSDASFKQRVVGIDAGSGIMIKAEKAIREHLAGYRLQASSGHAMTAELGRAYSHQQSIAVTAWEPHWLFAKWNVKFLIGGEDYFGNATQTHTVTRLGFAEDHPKAENFFQKFVWPSADAIGEVMLEIQEGAKPEAAAKDWVMKHSEAVGTWVEG